MGMIDQLVKYVTDFAIESEASYNVNPWIFMVLFFGSAIPLYYGYYMIGKSVIKFENKKFSRKEHVNTRDLHIGLVISVLAWWLPYLYVILFGKLPANLWILFGLFLVITGWLFVRTLSQKIIKTGKD